MALRILRPLVLAACIVWVAFVGQNIVLTILSANL